MPRQIAVPERLPGHRDRPEGPRQGREALLAAARAGDPLDRMRARYVRVVEYDVPDREGSGAHELFALITNILDPANVDARALAGLCVWRWEHELGNKQIKTYLRGPGKIPRSRSPDLVYQEIWGYLLTHFTIAALICQGATAAGIDPDKVRYTRTMRIVRRRVGDPSFSLTTRRGLSPASTRTSPAREAQRAPRARLSPGRAPRPPQPLQGQKPWAA